MCTTFHKDWSRHSKVNRGTYRHTDRKDNNLSLQKQREESVDWAHLARTRTPWCVLNAAMNLRVAQNVCNFSSR
jgi:hypothetical protein